MRQNKKEPPKKEAPKMAFRLPPKSDKEEAVEKPDPRALLKKAMARHDLHATGAEKADDKSNAKLREELQAAMDALDTDEA